MKSLLLILAVLVCDKNLTIYEEQALKAYTYATIWIYFKDTSLGYADNPDNEIECYSADVPFVGCLIKSRNITYLIWCDDYQCDE